MSTTNSDAIAALAAMRESRERLAAAAVCPPLRHLAFSGVLGSLVACQAAPTPITLGIEAVLLLAIGAIVAWDRRRTGMFINGYRAGRTQRLTFGLLAVTVVTLFAARWLKDMQGMVWAPVWIGVAVAIAAYFASRLWQRIYLRELRELP